LLTLAVPGCTWHSGGTDHHFGPVFFRYWAPTDRGADVGEVVRWGVLSEGGGPWALTLGRSARIVVGSPPAHLGQSQTERAATSHWSLPLSPFDPPTSGDWHLSLLYLQVTQRTQPLFVVRRSYGLEGVLGEEATALSVGLVSRTHFKPPDNAFAWLHFDAAAPGRSRARVWRSEPGRPIPADEIIGEIRR